MRISGNMSTGVRSAASWPTIMSSNAITTNVYGRFNAMRTMPIMPDDVPPRDIRPSGARPVEAILLFSLHGGALGLHGERRKRQMADYDYIIVGAGSAGGAL